MEKFNKILFCTDFSETADIAFNYACDLAQRYNSELYVFHVTSQPPSPTGKKKMEQKFKEKYLNAARYIEKCKDLKTEFVTRPGLDSEEIVKYVKEAGMDIIVMGTHGMAGFFRDMLVGSCARQVVRRSPVPVFVVPAAERANI